jgi:hypothetical protein
MESAAYMESAHLQSEWMKKLADSQLLSENESSCTFSFLSLGYIWWKRRKANVYFESQYEFNAHDKTI